LQNELAGISWIALEVVHPGAIRWTPDAVDACDVPAGRLFEQPSVRVRVADSVLPFLDAWEADRAAVERHRPVEINVDQDKCRDVLRRGAGSQEE